MPWMKSRHTGCFLCSRHSTCLLVPVRLIHPRYSQTLCMFAYWRQHTEHSHLGRLVCVTSVAGQTAGQTRKNPREREGRPSNCRKHSHPVDSACQYHQGTEHTYRIPSHAWKSTTTSTTVQMGHQVQTSGGRARDVV